MLQFECYFRAKLVGTETNLQHGATAKLMVRSDLWRALTRPDRYSSLLGVWTGLSPRLFLARVSDLMKPTLA